MGVRYVLAICFNLFHIINFVFGQSTTTITDSCKVDELLKQQKQVLELLQKIDTKLDMKINEIDAKLSQLHVERSIIVSCKNHGCPLGFTRYAQSCYLYFSKKQPGWEACQRYCKTFHPDANLVSIESEEEQRWAFDFIKRFNSGLHWVYFGGNDMNKEGEWVWIGTMQKINLTFWYPGEPNQGTGGNCLLPYAGRSDVLRNWDDATCDQSRPALCELRLTL